MPFLERSIAVGITDTELYVCPATLSGSAHGLTFSNLTAVARTITLKLFSQLSGVTTQITSAGQVIPANSQFTWPKPVNMVAGDKIIASADTASSVMAVIAVYLDQASMPSSAFVPRGAWSSVANYAVNDVVSSAGASYLAVTASLNSAPPSVNWMLLTAKGDAGTNGTNGINGAGITPQAVGFTAAGGTTNRTLTVDIDLATSAVATLAGVQTLTNKTLTGYTETVFTLAGTVIDPALGTIQLVSLAANRTFTETIANGQSVLLGIAPGAFSVTWPTAIWSKIGGSGVAPTLTSSGVNWIVLWKVSSTLRGALVGTA